MPSSVLDRIASVAGLDDRCQVANRLLRPPAGRDVAQEDGEGCGTGQVDPRHHHLQRELVAVGVHAHPLHRSPQHLRVGAGEQPLDRVSGSRPELLGQQQIADRRSDHLVAGVAEGGLRGRVELGDEAGGVDADDAVQRRVHDRALPRLAGTHIALGVAAADELPDHAADAGQQLDHLRVRLARLRAEELEHAGDLAVRGDRQRQRRVHALARRRRRSGLPAWMPTSGTQRGAASSHTRRAGPRPRANSALLADGEREADQAARPAAARARRRPDHRPHRSRPDPQRAQLPAPGRPDLLQHRGRRIGQRPRSCQHRGSPPGCVASRCRHSESRRSCRPRLSPSVASASMSRPSPAARIDRGCLPTAPYGRPLPRRTPPIWGTTVVRSLLARSIGCAQMAGRPRMVPTRRWGSPVTADPADGSYDS